jgi:carboxypeptidase Taq
MQAQAAYDELLRRARERSLLASCAALLEWDEETYLPRQGGAHRAEQLALLAGLEHAHATDPHIGELLDEVEGSPLVADADSLATANIREFRRAYDRVSRLPRALVEEEARITALGELAWAEARARADFAPYRPWLEKVVALKRREAECLGSANCPYDALLEEYEPGATTANLSRLFTDLREWLVPLANALIYARRRPDPGLLRRDFPVEQQRAFCSTVAAAVGYEFQRGRLDTAAHPFYCTIGPGDCRITTRYDPHEISMALFTMLHEVGHALYEQGLDPAYAGAPLGEAASIGMHESQARLWENTIGRSFSFWRHFFPAARQAFPAALGEVALEDFHFAVNHVEASPNRARADEVTYNLHILIRFELERALVNGDLRVADLPEAWNHAYRHTLGLTPTNDAEGCLQDSHWVAGLIGYFPTYTLGSIYAAQLFARARKDIGDLDTAFSQGDFVPLCEWLRDRVYRHGKRYPVPELIRRATGAPPSPQHLVHELEAKYRELYRV